MMGKQKRIAFDLDDVLVDFKTALDRNLFDRHGCHLAEMNTYKFEIAGGSDAVNWPDLIMDTLKGWIKIPIFWDVPKIMTAVYEITGEPIYIITSRPPGCEAETFMLIRAALGVPFKVSFVPEGGSKLSYLAGYDVMVEDRRKTALELAAAGILVFLVDKPWNKSPGHPKIVRIPDIKDLENYLIKVDAECTIIGSEVQFEQKCIVSDLQEIAQDIWDRPEKYCDEFSDAWNDFLKFLWIRYPSGKEVQLARYVNEL